MGAQPRKGSGSLDGVLPAKKKAYSPPVLITWGTLRDMTKHVGNRGHMDGGKSKNFRKTR